MSASSSSSANCRWDIVIPSHDLQPRNAMENFTAMVMEFAEPDPTRPITDVRKALIKKRLRDLFPYFRTPNHPPYSAMIHRAIGELKDPDGCTEESISKFIRGHYDDLPWCHSTLLNHHLQKLSECGEIVLTRSNCYLLSAGITNLESSHSSTPGRELVQGMQKLRSKKQFGQAGCCRKDQTKEKTLQGELMEVICGQFQVQEGHNLVIEGQNLAEEPQSETIEEPHAIQAREQEQQAVLIGDYNQLEGKTMDSEHLDVNQWVVLSPERPSVFDVGVVKEFSEFQQQQLPEESLLICSQQKNLKCNLETATASINLRSNSKQVLMKQQHEHSPPDLPLVGLKVQPDFSNSERPLEVCAWEKPFKSLDALEPLKSVDKLPGMQQLQDKQHVSKKHAISRSELEDVPKNSNQCFEISKAVNSPGTKLAAVAIPSPEDQLSSEKLCVRQKASKAELPPSTVSLSLPKQPDGKRKRTKSKSNTIGTEDVSLHSEKIAEIPNTEQCHGSETRLAESCIKEEVQPVKRRKRQKEPQYILALEAVTAAHGLLKDRKKQPGISVLEQSSQTNRRGRQLQNRGPKMSTSMPPMTSKTELFSLAGVQCQETGLPYQESSPKPKKIPVDESTQTLEQQASLRGHESLFKSHPMKKPTEPVKQYERQQKAISQKSLPLSKPKTRRSSLDSCLTSHTEPGQQPVSQNSERAKEAHYQLTPENSQNWRLCPQQSKSEAAAAEVVLVQDQNEQQQQQLDNHDGGRPLEQKFDMVQDVVELSKSHPQDQHEQKLPAPRGRGRLRKCLHNPQQQEKQKKGRGQGRHQNWRLCPQQSKSEAAAAEVVLVQDQNEQQQQQLDNHDVGRPLEQKFDMLQDVVELSISHPQDQHELPAPRGRGRPRKCLHNPQQQEKQKKGQGQGRHHRQKPDDATIEKQVQEPKRRGRPRKLDK